MTNTILNFSHPLSSTAKRQIEEAIGPFEEVHVPFHLEMERPITPQLESYIPDDEPTHLIAPALGPAAYLIRDLFPTTPVIWLKGRSPQTELGGIEGNRDNDALPGYYTARQVMETLGLKCIQNVSGYAKQEGWGRKKIGRGYIYLRVDVDQTVQDKIRTRLAKNLGCYRQRVGWLRDDSYDMVCPECGGFTLEKIPTLDELQAWASREDWPWLCEQGHTNINIGGKK